jgi:hypothetical protein
MAVSITETIGFCDQFRQFLENNKAALREKGLDVTDWITNTNDLKNSAVTETTRQDEMDVAARAQTKIAQAATKLAYDTTSTRVDAVMGVLGKSTPLAKEVGKLRSGIIRQSKRKTGGDDNT